MFPTGEVVTAPPNKKALSTEWVSGVLEAATVGSENAMEWHKHGGKVSPSWSWQLGKTRLLQFRTRKALNRSLNEEHICHGRSLAFQPRARRALTGSPQESHKPHSHNHSHTHRHKKQRMWWKRNHRHKVLEELSFLPRQQRTPHHWFSKPEYRLTVPEDVPIHTSILKVRVPLCLYLPWSNHTIDSRSLDSILTDLGWSSKVPNFLFRLKPHTQGCGTQPPTDIAGWTG